LRTKINKLNDNPINRIEPIKNKASFKLYFLLSLIKTKGSKKAKIKKIFQKENKTVPTRSESFFDLLKRPEITLAFLSNFESIPFEKEIQEEIEIHSKYEGYIKKTYKEVEKMIRLEEKQIPNDIDYQKIKNLASEARQKLEKVRPETLGQAARISGVNPSDLSILSVYLKKKYNK